MVERATGNAAGGMLPSALHGGIDGLADRLAPALDPDPDHVIEVIRTGSPGADTQVAAAVLVAFVRPLAGIDAQGDVAGHAVRVMMIRRPATMRRHAGQIAFPGGRIDPEDAGVLDAALREAHEEIALRPDEVTVIGHLPPLATQTGYVVAPVIGVVEGVPNLQGAPDEVAEILLPPASLLLDGAQHRAVSPVVGRTRTPQLGDGPFTPAQSAPFREQMPTSKPSSLPFEPRLRCAIAYRDHIIWGASAAILRVLYERLSAQ